MKEIRFAQKTGSFYRDLYTEVQAYLRSARYGPYAGISYWMKAIVLLFMVCLAYTAIIQFRSAGLLFFSFTVLGFSLLLFALNVAHDGSHNSISKSKKLNNFLYRFGFALQGANGFLWQKRHLHEHHPFPNVPDRDPDLLNVKWLRYASSQPFKKYHRWQCWYVLPLYAMYTLYWIFIKDFSRSGTPVSRKIFARMMAANVLHKSLYLFVFLGLPVWLNGLGLLNLWAFLFMHGVVSIFLVFTFAMSHYISGQPETEVYNGSVAGSWEMHQVTSSVDFHVNSNWALFIFGGFNCHIAHHLFPAVSHVHYPVITRMVYRHLQNINVKPRQISFWQGVVLHFKLLREMSVQKS